MSKGWFLALALLLAAPAAATEDAVQGEARDVVRGQLDAFRRDDAAGAFAFAAPGIRTMFGDAERFIAMVRQAYPPVYHSQSWSFGQTSDKAGTIGQIVNLVDGSGTVWTALYTLERQPDGTLKITACVLLQTPGENT